MHAMMRAILPSDVAVSETHSELDEPLLGDEGAAVADAVATRRAEFATTRICARRALAMLGHPATPVGRGPAGEPLWPAGIVGTLTHCDGYRAAAVAHRRAVVTLGIDAEPVGPLPDGVLALVASPAEIAHLAALAERRRLPWDRLLFSAKEAVYKAWFPVTGRWLEFRDVDVTFRPDGTFSARLSLDVPVIEGTPMGRLDGRWTVRDGHVATATVLPSTGGSGVP